jgi:hypothetical protein
MTALRELRLPEELCAAAEKKFGKKFTSVEELLVFILRELLRDQTAQQDAAEQRIVEERLRNLGYI